MIQKNFLDVLERWGIKGESAIGKPFDPALHAALSTVESTEYAPGLVAVEYKKAFFYKDKLLRPAEVVVVKESAQGPDASA
jgi:molecular chaperone GrpE